MHAFQIEIQGPSHLLRDKRTKKKATLKQADIMLHSTHQSLLRPPPLSQPAISPIPAAKTHHNNLNIQIPLPVLLKYSLIQKQPNFEDLSTELFGFIHTLVKLLCGGVIAVPSEF